MKDFLKLLILLCLPALSAGLAVMSIDYGAEWIKIAIVKPGVPMEIVLNKESQRKTASIVFIRDGERMFGNAALNSAIRYPAHAYRHTHELLGKHFDNPLVQQFIQQHPYYNIKKDPQTLAPVFQHDQDTTYTPEEIVAMILQKCKEYAETYAEQSISETVITVPPYMNQAERRAMLRAASLAGLNVLQLINDNTAVALNYGIFRRKSFNSTPVYYIFFDHGASSTTATVVEYHIAKHKSSSSGLVDTYPQLVVRGIGYDRQLGGIEMQYRLQNHLAAEFNKVSKSNKDVKDDPKAMQKLYKEAGRVKQVLSANAFHFAQVESLMDDIDFRVKVTREEVEEMCSSLIDAVARVMNDALKASQVSVDEVSEVILFGGGTRMPKVQEALKKVLGREELGKGLNTDEAAALGGVYQAAHLGMGFKVQKFNIKDLVLYPIQVSFARVRGEGEEGMEYNKMIHRTLFPLLSHFPHKKSITFSKHHSDFSFAVSYTDLSFLTTTQLQHLGNTTLSNVSISSVDKVFAKHNGSLARGIKAHFILNLNGLLEVDAVEASFEKTSVVEVEEESTLSKLGKSFSNFFGGGDDAKKKDEDGKINEDDGKKEEEEEKKDGDEKKGEDEKKEDEEKKDGGERKEEKKKEDEKKDEKVDDTGKSSDGKKDTEKTVDDKNTTDSSPKKKKEEKKSVVVKEPVKVSVEDLDLSEPTAEQLQTARKNLQDLKKIDDEKDELEKVKNELESFVFTTRAKLDEDEYSKCTTSEEKSAMMEKLNAAADWMDELPFDSPKKTFVDKLGELREMCEGLFERVVELRDRPMYMDALNDRMNQSELFLDGMKNYTGEGLIFTQVEFDTLQKLYTDIKQWNTTMQEAQSKLLASHKPVLTLQAIHTKVNDLDREIKYLVAKVKNFQAKVKKEEEEESKKKSSKKATTDKDDDNKADDDDDDTHKTEGGADDDVKVDGEKKKDGGKKKKGEKEKKKKNDDEKKEDLEADYLEIDDGAATKTPNIKSAETTKEPKKQPEHDSGEL